MRAPLDPPDPLPALSTIPDRLSPQLATLVDAPPKGSGWTYEIKLDGYRILARCEDGDTRLFTRNGNDWTAKMQSLAEEFSRLPIESAWFDCELVVQGANGIPDFNALQNAFDKGGTEAITCFLFDLLYLNGKDLRPLEYRQRRALLEAMFVVNRSDRVRA